jgi:hypothetical protein
MRDTRSHADHSPAVIKMACKPSFMHERNFDRNHARKMSNSHCFGLMVSADCRGRALRSRDHAVTGKNCGSGRNECMHDSRKAFQNASMKECMQAWQHACMHASHRRTESVSACLTGETGCYPQNVVSRRAPAFHPRGRRRRCASLVTVGGLPVELQALRDSEPRAYRTGPAVYARTLPVAGSVNRRAGSDVVGIADMDLTVG